MPPNPQQTSFKDLSIRSNSSDNNSAYENFERFINSVDNNSAMAMIPQSQNDDHQAPKERATSITFHSSTSGSGALDTSDTSSSDSADRHAKSKRRSSLFTRRPSSRKHHKNYNSNPEDRHAALDDEEGRLMFAC